MNLRRILIIAGIVLAVIGVLLVAVGTFAVARTNPPVTTTIQWDSPETEALVRRACFDCHSNETVWPWYSYIAPMAFLVAHDVEEGRENLNFSTDTRFEARDMRQEIERGNMPLPVYLPLHPEAQLTDAEKQQLIAGLQATFGG
ncbi:MAG TPA: heme-binding domain-containing protein [Aggregatilineales bacterium]|nr:heme-binding domain-containing protein [Aggregatilineales bacterium]